MFDFSQLQLEKLIIHKAGNKMKEEGCIISEAVYDLADGNVEELLLKYFLSSFKEKVVYKFFHEEDINLNELYMYVSSIFIDKQSFYEQSANIFKHLYDKSYHPQIKAGECYVVYFKECIVNEQL